MNRHKLTAEARSVQGRKVKSLRNEGVLPANIYGKKMSSLSVQLPVKEFTGVFTETGETGLIDLKVGKDTYTVLVGNVQEHPVSGLPLHVDFRQVDLKEKITATVPLEIVGEAPAEKEGLGTLVQQLDEVEVEALPADLPESIQVDTSKLLEVDQAILVGDLKYDKAKVEVKTDPELLVAKIEPPQEEVETPTAEEAEPQEAEAGENEPQEAEPQKEGSSEG